jgi:hypothetical protein
MTDERGKPSTRREFPEEVIDLLRRNRHKHTQKTDTRAPPRAALPGIAKALQEFLGSNKERYSTLLTAHSPGYDSEHPRDRAFGATGPARSHQWTGHSHAMLSPDIVQHRRAVQWAAMSTKNAGDKRIATALLLPYTDTDGGATPEHMQWARTAPHTITHIAALTGEDPHAESDVLWTRETHRAPPRTHHTDLLLVWTRPPASSWNGALRSRRR